MAKPILRFFLAFVFSFTAFVQLSAQELSVAAELDSNTIRLGEQVKINLYLRCHTGTLKNLKVLWPKIEDTLRKEIEVISVSSIDTTIPDKNKPDLLQHHQSITITSFDSGYWAIQPFIFIVNGDSSNPLITEPLLLNVHTVPVDTSEASVKDIKAPFEEPFNWKEYIPHVLIGLGSIWAIILIVYLIYRFTKKKKPAAPPPGPKEAPHLIALRNLELIKQNKLWQEGKIKEYYTGITDVLRVYIEGRFNIHAMELTSDEIMSVMKSQVIDALSREKLQQILALADYVKFAKAKPIDVENELAWNNAVDFVKGTLREEKPAQAPNNSNYMLYRK